MSASLHWKRVPVPPEDDCLSHELMYKIKGRLWPDGQIGYPIEVDTAFIPYLQGLADCNVVDAGRLISLIREHGAIILELRS